MRLLGDVAQSSREESGSRGERARSPLGGPRGAWCGPRSPSHRYRGAPRCKACPLPLGVAPRLRRRPLRAADPQGSGGNPAQALHALLAKSSTSMSTNRATAATLTTATATPPPFFQFDRVCTCNVILGVSRMTCCYECRCRRCTQNAPACCKTANDSSLAVVSAALCVACPPRVPSYALCTL